MGADSSAVGNQRAKSREPIAVEGLTFVLHLA